VAVAPGTPAPVGEPQGKDRDRSARRPGGHVGWIVAASLAAGLAAAVVLGLAPFIRAQEGEVTGALLCGLWAGECWPSLVVLTAGIGSDSKHLAAQDSLAGLSTNSAHRTNGGASHESLVADEAGAASTTQAILDVVSAVQRGGPLPR
jgi:hypothetical protein